MGISRRSLLAGAAGIAAIAPVARLAAMRPSVQLVDLSWLGGAPPGHDSDIVWGVPWPRGAVRPGTSLALSSGAALQSWPLAYWPDGSLKWTGHATSRPGDGPLSIAPGRPVRPAQSVTVVEDATGVVMRSGGIALRIPRSGPALIAEASVAGRRTIANLRLVARRQDSVDGADTVHTDHFESSIATVTVEQRGPVRALVRIDGHHTGPDRQWLPFTVRIALHAGSDQLRLVHSFVFDGDADHDFLSGLGITMDVPLTDEAHNRHIRFAGADGGVWGESVRNLPGWAPGKFALAPRFADQLDGRPVPTLGDMDAKTRDQLLQVPSFGAFKLFQSSADHFDVRKRTVPGKSWLDADHGTRAVGLAYVGGVSGGAAFGMRDFWQRHPGAVEIAGADGDAAAATLWMWSPDAPPMDMRPYSPKANGLEINYEDVEPGFSTPNGIARTTEIQIRLLPATPSRAAFSAMAEALRSPPLLVCTPQHYAAVGAFGIWSLPDRSHPVKAALEDQHDRLLAYYLKQVDRRQWYGFWNYGDVMHSYDADRHVWRYDVGGYAWANSELVPDIWFWYAFLRSGRIDLFRHAEAMTRHTGEVDVYHSGRFKGLGSRHNVSHWGDGSKELRISQALLRRPYYYLTADARTGDLMTEVINADQTLGTLDPLRKVLPKTDYPHARSGPDWFAAASNWMTAWERTGDVKWRDRILIGLRSIAAMPQGMFSGSALRYDPATGGLFDIGRGLASSYHLVTIMGGAEFIFELNELIDEPGWKGAWLQFCRLYNAPEAERIAALGPRAKSSYFGFAPWHARLTAYAAGKTGDAALARRAWSELLGADRPDDRSASTRTEHLGPPQILAPLDDLRDLSTNHASQWSLNLIEVLALAKDAAPAALPSYWQS